MELGVWQSEKTARNDTLEFMEVLKLMNLALSFVIEVAALIACAYWAYRLPVSGLLKIIGAVVTPIIFIAIWSLFLSPQADFRLPMVWLVVGKLVIFGIVAAMLHVSGQKAASVVFGSLVLVNTALAVFWDQK